METFHSSRQRRVAIDDVHFFQDILPGIQGVGLYPDRSVVHPYAAVYLSDTGDIEQAQSHYADYMRPLGLGPDELRFVKGCDLFEGVMRDPHMRDQLRTELSNGSGFTLETFSSYGRWGEFVQELELNTDQLRTPLDLDLVRQLDDKAGLRAFAREEFGKNGERHVPAHRLAYTPQEIWNVTGEMLHQHPGLVVKRPDLEGGESMMCVNNDTNIGELRAWTARHCDGESQVLIEEDLRLRPGARTVEASLQWYVPKWTQPQKRFFSTQDIVSNAHRGNAIASNDYDSLPAWLPERTRIDIVRTAWELTSLYVEIMWSRGYVGYIGFDLMVVINSNGSFEVIILEVNARKTAGTYLESMRWHIQNTYLPGASAVMRNVKPKGITHWRQAVRRLCNPYHPEGEGNISFNAATGTGVIILAPRLLPHKLVVIASAPTIEHAQRLANAAENRLSDPHVDVRSRMWLFVQRLRAPSRKAA